MFKKIEIWVLYATLLGSLLFAIGFGTLVRQELEGNTKLGVVSETALLLAKAPAVIGAALEKEELDVEDRFPSLGGFVGGKNDYESYLLLSRYDGDLRESIIELVDLTSFEVLHFWNPDLDTFNSLVSEEGVFQNLQRDNANNRDLLTHPLLLDDGDIIFQRNSPLRKIDACSELVFQNTSNIYHHSIERDSEGNIWVPSFVFPSSLSPEIVGDEPPLDGFLEDALVKLSPSGLILYQKSVAEIFIENDLEYLLFGQYQFNRDPTHLNDIQPVNFDSEYWRKGDLFLSIRNQSMVLLYRPSTNKILWKGTGPFFLQHDVNILDASRISVFNNNVKAFPNGSAVDGNNEIIIYNFESDEYSSYLSQSMKKNDVRTVTAGRGQILPNGDLFVEESNFGRTLLVSKTGSLKWSHVNRATDGKVYRVSWSRLIYKPSELKSVRNFLAKVNCHE